MPMASHGVISQGSTLRGQVAVAFRLCPILALLMGRAQARPLFHPFISGLPGAASAARAQKSWHPSGDAKTLNSPQSSDQAASRCPLHRQTSNGTSPLHSAGPKRLSAHLACTQRAHAPRQARSSRWPAGERVRPGVTAALPLTLAAASH